MAKKTKRRKRAVVKRKTAKKVAGKKSHKRKTARKKVASKRVSKAKKPSPRPQLPAEPVGRVTHYFPKVRATAVLIERDGIRVGDTLYF